MTRADRQKTLAEIEDEEPAVESPWDDIEAIENARIGRDG